MKLKMFTQINILAAVMALVSVPDRLDSVAPTFRSAGAGLKAGTRPTHCPVISGAHTSVPIHPHVIRAQNSRGRAWPIELSPDVGSCLLTITTP